MDLALNKTTWDLDIVNGDLYLLQDADAVAQFVGQKLKLFLTEWFLDEAVGLPFFDAILVKNPNPTLVDSLIKTAILETPGIVELTQFLIDYDNKNRKLQVTFQARTKTGAIYFSQAIP